MTRRAVAATKAVISFEHIETGKYLAEAIQNASAKATAEREQCSRMIKAAQHDPDFLAYLASRSRLMAAVCAELKIIEGAALRAGFAAFRAKGLL